MFSFAGCFQGDTGDGDGDGGGFHRDRPDLGLAIERFHREIICVLVCVFCVFVFVLFFVDTGNRATPVFRLVLLVLWEKDIPGESHSVR